LRKRTGIWWWREYWSKSPQGLYIQNPGLIYWAFACWFFHYYYFWINKITVLANKTSFYHQSLTFDFSCSISYTSSIITRNCSKIWWNYLRYKENSTLLQNETENVSKTQTSKPQNCKIFTEMFQKLINFYTPSTCKHMHQIKDNQNNYHFTKNPKTKKSTTWYSKNCEHKQTHT
jgi:hypothetical protein